MSPEAYKRALVRSLIVTLDGGKSPLPEGGSLVWGWFAALCGTRTYGYAGPNPIAFIEIEAYARLHRWRLERRHVDLIRALDAAWLAHARTQSAGDTDAKTRLPLNAPGITVAAFDAVFG